MCIRDRVAVLDPKRKDCRYPFKELSGCGVGFKLCQGLNTIYKIPEAELFELTDLPVSYTHLDVYKRQEKQVTKFLR